MAERKVPAQGAPVSPAVEALAGLLAGAMSGRGYRGPSSDPGVLARRLVESERVHVDVPGRLSSDQVVALAQRRGRAMLRAEALEAELAGARAEAAAALAEAEAVRERLVVVSRDLELAMEARELVEDEAYGWVRGLLGSGRTGLGVAS